MKTTKTSIAQDGQADKESMSQQLKMQAEARLLALAQEVDAARISEEMQRYFKVMRQFHRYSLRNQILIAMECERRGLPLGLAASFKNWKKLFGRHVRKGQKGIPILFPRQRKRRATVIDPETGEPQRDPDGGEIVTEEKTWTDFAVGYTFVYAQTDGEPLPEAPKWSHEGAEGGEIYDAVRKLARAAGVPVEEKEIEGTANGYHHVEEGIALQQNRTPKGNMATLLHEWAHYRMHPLNFRTAARRRINELEAEATAWLVADYFGYDLGYAPNYIALHQNSGQDLLACMDRISKAAREIIEAIEEQKEVA